jgi:hypothetical protein
MHIEQKPSTNLQTELGWEQQPSATISHHSNQEAIHHEDSRKVKASKSIIISVVSKLDFNFLVNPFLFKKDKTFETQPKLKLILLTLQFYLQVREELL